MSTIAISSSERESLSLLVGRRIVDVIVPLPRTPSGRFIQLDSEREPLAQSWFDIWLDDGAKFTIDAHFIRNGTFEFYTISVERSIRQSGIFAGKLAASGTPVARASPIVSKSENFDSIVEQQVHYVKGKL